MDALCLPGRGCAVLQLRPPSSMASDRTGRRSGVGLATRTRRALREGADGGPPRRMGIGRAVAPDSTQRAPRSRMSRRGHGHARSVDLAGVDCGVESATLEPVPAALCINRSGRGRPRSLPDAQRTSGAARTAPLRSRSAATGTGGPLTTDRLITPFHASRAQSDPRKVSPMNFIGSSRSIQRLLAARPLLTCWSRGRA